MAASRVLVIDDSTTLRKVVEIAMRGTGCEVELAANGSDGVALAQRRRPDVILLDYLLPDLRSAEVCQRLGADPHTAGVPVIIMSANHRGVLDDFRGFPFVVGFIGKPFTAPEIRGRLEAAIQRAAATRSGTGPAGSDRSAHAARSRAAGDASTAGAERDGGEPADDALRLRGDLAVTPLMEVLRLLAAAHATGVVVIALRRDSAASQGARPAGEPTARISLRRGEILLCTSTDDDGWLSGDSRSESRAELTAELRERVTRNLAIGKPALVTLAEAGVARAANLPLELHAASTRLLAELIEARSGRFVWEPAVALPEVVEAFGRQVSLTALALELARRTAVSVPLASVLDRIYDRTPRFSEKLAGARLDVAEQRVLSVVDGRSSGRDIVARVGRSLDSVAQALTRLCAADLVSHSEVSQLGGARTLAVLDGDRDELVAPLRARLARRQPPFEVVELDPARPVAATTREARADVVLIGVAQLTAHVIEHELPIIARDGSAAVVCVLEAPNTALASRMLQAGLHAVLAKPVHVTEIERLLSVT